MTSRYARAFLLLTAAAGCSAAQPAEPKFEAVSIHELQAPYRILGERTVSGSRIRLEGYTVGMLVAEAYGKKPYETATPPEPAALQGMLQNMLAERFHLKAHKEIRNVPVYALVVSKDGPRLKAGTGELPCRRLPDQ